MKMILTMLVPHAGAPHFFSIFLSFLASLVLLAIVLLTQKTKFHKKIHADVTEKEKIINNKGASDDSTEEGSVQSTASSPHKSSAREYQNSILAKLFQGTFSKKQKLQIQFLVCYLTSTSADWVQGPYVYALYDSYGYTKNENAFLFVAGFGTSMIFGAFIGALSDQKGRKNACLMYCGLYIMSALLKHVKIYEVLMIGRIMGGLATSLLFSAFDSWIVCEHEKRNLGMEAVSDTFSSAVYYNGVVAVLAGLLAQAAASIQPLTQVTQDFYIGGYVAPFDLSIIFCTVSGLLIMCLWTENYGERKESETIWKSLNAGMNIVIRNRNIFMIGCVTSLYESAMYIFVFNWTPALTPEGQTPPYGFIFATFMLCCMLGSQIFSYCVEVLKMKSREIAVNTLAVATIAHVLLLLQGTVYLNLIAFLLFEITVGVYFPAMGTIKAEMVPEAYRSTVYNIFRIPLNFIVIGTLCIKTSLFVSFMIGTALLAFGSILLYAHSKEPVHIQEDKDDEV